MALTFQEAADKLYAEAKSERWFVMVGLADTTLILYVSGEMGKARAKYPSFEGYAVEVKHSPQPRPARR